MIRVKSKVYSMDFFNAPTISALNVKFERVGTFKEYYDLRQKISYEKKHYQTGMLSIDVPQKFKTIDQAKKYAYDLIFKLRILLSLCHDHDVPINEFIFFNTNTTGEEEIGHEFYANYFGEAGSSTSFFVRPNNIGRFLELSLNLLDDNEYVNNTEVRSALIFYNLSSHSLFLEIEFSLLWMSLESLANAYYDHNKVNEIITKDEWLELKNRCRAYLNEIGKKEVYNSLLNNISVLRRGTIKERIEALFSDQKYHMMQYFEDVRNMYDNIRVPFFHGRIVDWANYTNEVHRLRRLIQKLLFKTLNFYENEPIEPVIKDPDLSAR